MIERVGDAKVNSAEDPKPLVLVPVEAEDVERRKRRVWLGATAVVLLILIGAGLIYKHYTDPLNAKASFDAGTRLFKVARYNEAILSFDRAISYKPDLVDAYLMRGRSYVGEAEPEKALRDFSKVIELRPDDPAGWVARGAAYLDLNNIQAASADASRAIAVNPKIAMAYNLRGAAYRRGGDATKALEDFNRAVELDPNADNLYQRGATYQMLGEHKLAIDDFTKVIEIIPDLSNAFFARAESKRAIGDLQGAEEDHHQGRVLDGQ